jgi:hypothetical protein
MVDEASECDKTPPDECPYPSKSRRRANFVDGCTFVMAVRSRWKDPKMTSAPSRMRRSSTLLWAFFFAFGRGSSNPTYMSIKMPGTCLEGTMKPYVAVRPCTETAKCI